MGRPERGIDPADGPVAAFACTLRELRQHAGAPTYGAMARKAHRSSSVLAEAAGGTSLPTLDTTLAYVAVCGGDAAEWTERWHATRAAIAPQIQAPGPQPAPGTADPGPAMDLPSDSPASLGRPRLVAPRALVAVVVVGLVGAAAVWGLREDGATADTAVPAVAGVSSSGPATTTPAVEEALTIEQPTEGGTVAMLDDVVIHRSGTSVGNHVWILVQFVGGPVTNPQGDCSTQDGVTYICAKAQFGDPDTSRATKFEIRAVEVDEEGHLALQSLVAAGFNPALRPVPYLAESDPVVVSRR